MNVALKSLPVAVAVLVGFVILFAVMLLGWLLNLIKEPSYHGKTLTRWVYRLPVDNGEALTAVQKIGTNAFPTLLGMVAANDGALKAKVIKLVNGQGIIHVKIHRADEKRLCAFFAFEVLGRNALPAVPALIKLTKHRVPQVRKTALDCLFIIRPDKSVLLPVLKDCSLDSDAEVKKQAANYIHQPVPSDSDQPDVNTLNTLFQLFGSPATNAVQTNLHRAR